MGQLQVQGALRSSAEIGNRKEIMSSVLVGPSRSPEAATAPTERRSREASRLWTAVSSRVYLPAAGIAALAAVLVGIGWSDDWGGERFAGSLTESSCGPRRSGGPGDHRDLSHRGATLAGTAATPLCPWLPSRPSADRHECNPCRAAGDCADALLHGGGPGSSAVDRLAEDRGQFHAGA